MASTTNFKIKPMRELLKSLEIKTKMRGLHFHRTDVNGLLKIISSGQLRLSRYDSMWGDPNEGNHIFTCIFEACSNLLSKDMISRNYYYELVEKISLFESSNKFYHRYGDEGLVECTPFITCMTQDCKKMWDEKNFCIKINNHHIIDDLNSNLVNCIAVQYNKEDYIKKFEEIIRGQFINNCPVDKLVEELKHWVTIFRFSYKPEKYSWQKESRIVLFIPNDERLFDKYAKLNKHSVIIDGNRHDSSDQNGLWVKYAYLNLNICKVLEVLLITDGADNYKHNPIRTNRVAINIVCEKV